MVDLTNSVTVAVFVGFTVGKPVGVLSFSFFAVRLGIAIRPPGLGWRELAGGGLLAGIGFTMALFIASLGFGENLMNSAKIGIFAASVVSAAAGLAVLMWTPGHGNHRLGAERIKNVGQNDQTKSEDRWSHDGGQN
jgi:NhaA family Na+:H+ antiporter